MSVNKTQSSGVVRTRPTEIPATGLLIGTPDAISPRVAPQTDAIEATAVRFQNVTDHANGVGEVFRVGKHGSDTPFGKATVADFSSTGAPDRPTFPHRERREVVVEHELLAVFVDQSIDTLLIASGTERHRDQRLGLATLEQRRTVHLWQKIGFAVDLSQAGVVAAVGSSPGDDQLADDLFFKIMPHHFETLTADRAFGFGIGNHLLHGAIAKRGNGFGAIVFAGSLLGGFEVVVVGVGEPLQEPVIFGGHEFAFLRIHFLVKLFLQIDDFANHPMGELNRFHHLLFGHLVREAFDHCDLFPRTADDHVEFAALEFCMGRESDQLAIDLPHADTGDGALKRQLTDVQGQASTVHGQHVAVVLHVAGDDECLDLDLVQVTVGPQRADGTVHQPCAQRFFGARSSFAFQKPTGEFSGRCKPLAVITHEREEVESGARIARGRGDEHDGLAVLHQNTRGGLFGKLPRLKRKRLPPNLLLDTNLLFCHFQNSSLLGSHSRGALMGSPSMPTSIRHQRPARNDIDSQADFCRSGK